MKIYFAGSIRAGRDDAVIYQSMINILSSYGEVLTEHVGDPSLSEKGDDGYDDRNIYDRDMQWLSESQVVVAEVTAPSLGVGYELGCASAMKKPILCLYRPSSSRILSAMIAGNPHINTTPYYSLDEAKDIIEQFLRAEHLVCDKEGIRDC